MNRDKQIEMHELAKQMSEAISTAVEQRYIEDEAKLEAVLRANGWCKVTDVVDKIFVEIEKALDNSVETEHFKGTWFNFSKFKQRLAELRKKYEILTSWEELTHTCQVEIPHTIESIADLAFTESEGEG